MTDAILLIALTSPYWFLPLVFALVSAVIAKGKHRSSFGWFLMGALVGPVGLVVALLPAKTVPAPEDLWMGWDRP